MNDTIEQFGIFAIRVKIATWTSPSLDNGKISKKKKIKWSIYNIQSTLLLSSPYNIPSSCIVAEIGLPVPKSTHIHALIKFANFAIVHKICCSPNQIFTVNSPWCALQVWNIL